jgi:hypothetical protein
MTPEERRARAEYVVEMAKLGILAEPSYDREAWRDEFGTKESPVRPAPTTQTGTSRPPKKAPRKTA